MEYILPEPASFHPQHPINKRDRAEKALVGGDGVPPVVNRPVSNPNNISMYDHLHNIIKDAEEYLNVDIKWDQMEANNE